MDDFEKAMLAEVEAIQTLLDARRTALIAQFTATSHEAMGRMFALGAIDSALWRLHRRISGEGVSGEC